MTDIVNTTEGAGNDHRPSQAPTRKINPQKFAM